MIFILNDTTFFNRKDYAIETHVCYATSLFSDLKLEPTGTYKQVASLCNSAHPCLTKNMN